MSFLGFQPAVGPRDRHASVSSPEAEAKLAQRRAELTKLLDQANFEIDQAYEEVRETTATVRLYETTILKDAEANVDAARPAYKTGLIPASNLLEAERALVDLQDRYFQAIADYHRRLASLERAIGGAQN